MCAGRHGRKKGVAIGTWHVGQQFGRDWASIAIDRKINVVQLKIKNVPTTTIVADTAYPVFGFSFGRPRRCSIRLKAGTFSITQLQQFLAYEWKRGFKFFDKWKKLCVPKSFGSKLWKQLWATSLKRRQRLNPAVAQSFSEPLTNAIEMDCTVLVGECLFDELFSHGTFER